MPRKIAGTKPEEIKAAFDAVTWEKMKKIMEEALEVGPRDPTGAYHKMRQIVNEYALPVLGKKHAEHVLAVLYGDVRG